MKINELTQSIDEICEKLKNKQYRNIAKSHYRQLTGKKTNQEHKLVASLIQDEYSLYDISKTTIWRLLKIKKERPDLYKKVASGELKIRTAFEMINPCKTVFQKKREPEPEPDIDLAKIQKYLIKVNEGLSTNFKDMANQPTETEIKCVSVELFNLRKTLDKIYNYYFSE